MTLAIIGAVVVGLNGLLAQWIAYLVSRNAQRVTAATLRTAVDPKLR